MYAHNSSVKYGHSASAYSPLRCVCVCVCVCVCLSVCLSVYSNLPVPMWLSQTSIQVHSRPQTSSYHSVTLKLSYRAIYTHTLLVKRLYRELGKVNTALWSV